MKQMSLIEMDGFLKGKCIPRDLKVNETNAEYLVRKFAEAEAKISALSEDHQKAIESIKQADAAVKLAHEKFSAMAAENARLKSAVTQQIELRAEIKKAGRPPHADFWVQSICEAEEKVKRALEETPATDAFLAEVRAQGVDMARNAMIDFVDGEVGPNKNVPGLIRGAEICVSIAEQLRKGGNQ
ncbi:TPA: hNH endonuclease [Escherichia coli]|nr:hNH endonuclease [Escherichia coli]HBD5324327.1 hNH endonuclease [Escherichia coli]HBK3277847.1 hNH endonuclease [Escherichia coli]